jgi:hypothetical protein
MMNFMAHHQQQLAAFAQQQGLSNERAMEILYETLRKQQAQPQQVVQILQQTLINPNMPNEPRPPPPSYGPSSSSSSSSRQSRDVTFPFPYSSPAALKPQPTAVPMLQPAAQATALPVLPETPVRTRSRSASKARGRPKIKEDVELVPVIDTPMPSVRKREASQDVERIPVVVSKPRQKMQVSEGAGNKGQGSSSQDNRPRDTTATQAFKKQSEQS